MIRTLHITIPELLKRWNHGEIPESAEVSVTYDDTLPKNSIPADHPNASLLALMAQWDTEDEELSPVEIEKDRLIYAEIEKNGIPRTKI